NAPLGELDRMSAMRLHSGLVERILPIQDACRPKNLAANRAQVPEIEQTGFALGRLKIGIAKIETRVDYRNDNVLAGEPLVAAEEDMVARIAAHRRPLGRLDSRRQRMQSPVVGPGALEAIELVFGGGGTALHVHVKKLLVRRKRQDSSVGLLLHD